MKKNLLLVSTIFFCSFLGVETNASWYIDAYKFQTSIHGENSCLDCHENIPEQERHPNPEDVNKDRSEFFDPEQCLICHEEVIDNLEQGIHGDQEVTDPEKYEFCISCHDPHYQPIETGTSAPLDLPPFSEEDAECMTCHGKPETGDPKEDEKVVQLCFHCHGNSGTPAQEITKTVVPLIDTAKYVSAPHAELACTVCHVGAASFPHSDQKLGKCFPCHRPHDEKQTHAAHLNVSCEACHLQGVVPIKDTRSQGIVWKKNRNLDKTSNLHHMVLSDDEATCRRCHFEENEVGAAAMVLPAKSLLCMPCHAATFSVGDTTTVISLAVFLLGIVSMFSYFLTGSIAEFSHADWLQKLSWLIRSGFKSLFSSQFKPIAASLFFDVLLQRRLYRQSPKRWAIHGLIFFPFVIRFLWGIIALLASLWVPSWSPVWDMLNKNHPTTAFLFDLTGFMIILGLMSAVVRTRLSQPQRPRGLPQQDLIALGLVAGIVVVGFVLEGMRIAMTGSPPGSAFAFIGYIISQLFSTGPGLNQTYGYVWYAHAILTGVFVAYIPFSRLSHIILAPVSLSIRASAEHDHT